MTAITARIQEVKGRPILTGVLTVLAVLSVGVAVAFATGLMTPSFALAHDDGNPPPPPTSVGCTLSIDQGTVDSGKTYTVSWTTTGATALVIDNGMNSVTPVEAGSKTVTGTNNGDNPITITYNATATGPGATAHCSVSVVIKPCPPTPPPPPPPTPTCKTYPPGDEHVTGSVTGGHAILTVPADACPVKISFSSYELPDGKLQPFSHQVLFDNITDTYGPGTHNIGPLKLACNWQTDLYWGDVQTTIADSGTVGLIAANYLAGQTCNAPKPPTCTLTANPTSIAPGDSSTLSWTTTNATSFSIDNTIGAVTPVDAGNHSVTPSVTTTYTGTAKSSDGKKVTCTAVVTVTHTPPPPPSPTCTLTADKTSIEQGGSSTLSWTTTHVASTTIDQNIGAVTPVDAGTQVVTPSGTTTYTLTGTGAYGTVTCPVTITVTNHPAPSCTLSISPNSLPQGGGSATLTWTTAFADTFTIDQNVGAVTPVASGTTNVSVSSNNITYTGTAVGAYGTTTCSAPITVETSGGGCTSNCGGGGGGGHHTPRVTLESAPTNPLAFVYLSQIPYTGLDLGPVGTVIYWLALILWSLALAYLFVFKMIPYMRNRTVAFGQSVHQAINTEPVMQSSHAQTAYAPRQAAPASPEDDELVHAHYSANVEPVVIPHTEPIETPYEPTRGYSTYDGFKSFGDRGALTIEDIVKGLAREPIAPVQYSAPKSAAPVAVETPTEQHPASARAQETPTDVRGFIAALVQGDKEAAFGTLRNVVRGGGSVESFITNATVAFDDAYRARIDGSPVDGEVARITSGVDTPKLEKLVGALATAVDSSYSMDATGGKLAITRALGIIAG